MVFPSLCFSTMKTTVPACATFVGVCPALSCYWWRVWLDHCSCSESLFSCSLHGNKVLTRHMRSVDMVFACVSSGYYPFHAHHHHLWVLLESQPVHIWTLGYWNLIWEHQNELIGQIWNVKSSYLSSSLQTAVSVTSDKSVYHSFVLSS